jgi:glutamyl-tRNA synthetase
VIRGEDHVSNTPTQINILRALGADPPVYAHVPNINGEDGRKLSKRRQAVALDDFRDEGYVPAALVNFLALLGWSYDDKTTIMSRRELIERFSLERVVPSPATFDYQKLDWMNGVYLRELQPEEYAHWLIRWLEQHGYDWPTERVTATTPLVQEKIEKFSKYPDYVRFLFEDVEPPAGVDARTCRAAADRLEHTEPWEATSIEEALRALVEELGEKPRQAFQQIRLAVTGSKVSPSLFESLELLGREESLRRLRAVDAAAA